MGRAERPATELHWSAISEAEWHYLVVILPPGGRCRDTLAFAVDAFRREDLEGRILPFDSDSEREYAAIPRSRGMEVTTRNVRDFRNIKVDAIDPRNAT